MTRLYLHGRQIDSVFQLLGEHENDISYSVAWALAWIPFAFIFGMALFALVIMAVLAALAIWIVGMLNALRGLENRLPVIGRLAERLPISGLR